MSTWRAGKWLCFCGLAALAGGQNGQAQERPDRVPGEFLVQLRSAKDAAALDEWTRRKLESPNVSRLREMAGNGEITLVSAKRGVALVKAPAEMDSEKALGAFQRALQASPAFRRVQPNFLYYRAVKPNDPLIDEMWFLDTISAFDAWDIQHDSPEIVVAVIDTGIHMNHQDLKSNIWLNEDEIAGNQKDDDGNGYEDDVNGWDFHNNDNDPSADSVPVDRFPPFCVPHLTKRRYEAHGSHVAGTIGALGDNGKGSAGVSWRVRIMPLKFLGGTCGSGSTAHAIQAIDYAVANGAKIINNSWGGGSYDDFLLDAIKAANGAGVLFVAAAGNSGSNNDSKPHYPSSYDVPNVLAVAASNQNDQKASFSNYGQSVDVFAPGTAILSTIPIGNENNPKPKDGYGSFSGTSMATPVVSGSAALIASKYPSLTHVQIKDVLLATADKRPSLSRWIPEGRRLNVQAALAARLPERIEALVRKLPAEFRQKIEKKPLIRIQLLLNPPFDQELNVLKDPLTQTSHAEQNLTLSEFLVRLRSDTDPNAVGRLVHSKTNALRVLDVESVSPTRGDYLITVASSRPVEEVLPLLRKVPEFLKVGTQKIYRKDE